MPCWLQPRGRVAQRGARARSRSRRQRRLALGRRRGRRAGRRVRASASASFPSLYHRQAPGAKSWGGRVAMGSGSRRRWHRGRCHRGLQLRAKPQTRQRALGSEQRSRTARVLMAAAGPYLSRSLLADGGNYVVAVESNDAGSGVKRKLCSAGISSADQPCSTRSRSAARASCASRCLRGNRGLLRRDSSAARSCAATRFRHAEISALYARRDSQQLAPVGEERGRSRREHGRGPYLLRVQPRSAAQQAIQPAVTGMKRQQRRLRPASSR